YTPIPLPYGGGFLLLSCCSEQGNGIHGKGFGVDPLLPIFTLCVTNGVTTTKSPYSVKSVRA
ncbi:MAG: hypothetical protein RRY29_08930, partial [Desulfovibrionaceae bacterium]